MTLLWTEGFDHENVQADLVTGGIATVYVGGTVLLLSSAATRWNYGNYLALTQENVGGVLFTLPSTYTTGFMGGAYLMGSQASFGAILTLGFFSGSPSLCQWSVDFINDGTGTVKFYRGYSQSGGTLIGSAAGKYASIESWHSIELGGTIDPAAGVCTVKMDGVQLASITGVNNQGTTGTTFGQFGVLYSGSALFTVGVDDLSFCDSTGSAPWNTFLGDTRVQTLFTTANDAVQFTPLTGANWQEVSEVAMDSDTSYNFSSTAGQQDTFSHGAIVGTPQTIFGVSVVNAVRKDDAAVHTSKNVLKSGGTTVFGSTQNAQSAYFYQKGAVFQVDPNTTAAWLLANVNASKPGYNLVS